ncbi:hypothetical protein [Flagellimonas sp.]|uniref:hypothetical protein n=1 Tax=Flagellimonas sp. TaxID=2058762 RepID=UPI003BACC5EB
MNKVADRGSSNKPGLGTLIASSHNVKVAEVEYVCEAIHSITLNANQCKKAYRYNKRTIEFEDVSEDQDIKERLIT